MLLISKKDKPLFEAGEVVTAIDEEDFTSKIQIVKGADGLPHLYISSTHRKYTVVVPACLSLSPLNLTFAETKELVESDTKTVVIYRAAQSTGLTRKEQIEKGIADKIKVTGAFAFDYATATDDAKKNPANYIYSYEYVDENKAGDKVEVR